MSDLADAVLPLIRSRGELWRRGAASRHGAQMHEGVDLLEAAVEQGVPREWAEIHSVTQRALASAITVIARADDSSGIIGDACRRLLALHPRTAAAASVPPARLVEWMMKFQFGGKVDFFEIDPVAYAPALGEKGVAAYRARLEEVRDRVGPVPAGQRRWDAPHSHERWVLEWNDRRLAVLDHDIEAIIRTHARDRKVAAWLDDTATAFEEIGEFDLAIDWARQAMDIGPQHQSLRGADHWCRLLAEHRPDELLEARLLVFRRWPSSATAARLYKAAGSSWPELRDEVMATLAKHPDAAVTFTLDTLGDVRGAWELAHSLGLGGGRSWSALVAAYEKVDPLAVLPAHAELVEAELVVADARGYRNAARRLARMRQLAAGSGEAPAVDAFVAEVRERNRRRPRLQQEFDKAGLP